MAFAEDLDAFVDADDFAVPATLAAVSVRVIFDAPGVDLFDGAATSSEPSILIAASAAPTVGQSLVLSAGGLPSHLDHHAGTYTIRHTEPEAPDGVFVRVFLVKAS